MPASIPINLDIEKALRQDLCDYIMLNSWNETKKERRKNLVLRAISQGRSAMSIYDLGHALINLPDTTNRYVVYLAPHCCMNGLVVDPDEYPDLKNRKGWTALSDYLNQRPFDLRIHGIHGEWLHRGLIYIANHPYMDAILVAIDLDMMRKSLGPDASLTTVYMSIYYDSDEGDSPVIASYKVEVASMASTIYNAYHNEARRDRMMCFINGRESIPESVQDIVTGDYVELVYDPDIIGSFYINMADSRIASNTLRTSYRSEIDGTFKYIVHIPKAINPENYVITHNTMDFFVRPVNGSRESRLSGLFVHRFNTSLPEDTYERTRDTMFQPLRNYYTKNENGSFSKYTSDDRYGESIPEDLELYVKTTSYLSDGAITQITHADVGVSDSILLPYMESIGSSECLLRVVVRRHGKTGKLGMDSNFLRILYQFDDDTIIKFLNGTLKQYCPFWQASELEKSEWVKMIINPSSNTGPEMMEHYVKALGYYNSICVVTPRVQHATVSVDNTNFVEFPIPRMYQYLVNNNVNDPNNLHPRTLDVIFSIDGVVQSTATYQGTPSPDFQYYRITLTDSNARFTPGSKLTVEFFESTPQKAFRYVYDSWNKKTSFVFDQSVMDDEFEIWDAPKSRPKDYPPLKWIDWTVTDVDSAGNTVEPHWSSGLVYKNRTDSFLKTQTYTSDSTGRRTSMTLTLQGLTHNRVYFLSKDGYVRTNSTELAARVFDDWPDNLWDKPVIGFQVPASLQTHNGDGTLNVMTTNCIPVRQENIKYSTSPYNWQNSYTDSRIPVIDPDWNFIVFMNGRELIEDVDYKVIDLEAEDPAESTTTGYSLGRVIVFNVNGFGQQPGTDYWADSYLNRNGDNYFDIIATSDRRFMMECGFTKNTTSYMDDSYMTNSNVSQVLETNPYIYWFDQLCTMTADGHTVWSPEAKDGMLQAKGAIRNGAFYGVRGFIPRKIDKYISLYANEVDDVTKLGQIAEYIKSTRTGGELEYDIVQHSHHITSLTTLMLHRDVKNGNTRLDWTNAKNMLKSMAEPYRVYMDFDAAFTGYNFDLVVGNASNPAVNGTYRLKNLTASGADRIWQKTSGNVTIQYKNDRWEFVAATIYNEAVLYHGDANTNLSPWEVLWVTDNPQYPNVPVLDHAGIDNRYIDILPTYEQDTFDPLNNVMLQRLTNVLLPTDATKDGATTI